MKNKLNWQKQDVVNIFDEASLWSAPFGRMLLENIPMESHAKILDLGFGTGFPLIELSQRFGAGSMIYGMDIWDNAIRRAKTKMNVLELDNIHIFEESANSIPLPDNYIDLICSNLGINNFEEKTLILKEAFRVLKTGGSICITTNPVGTFYELFEIFEQVLQAMALPQSLELLKTHIDHRGIVEGIIEEFENTGFKNTKVVGDSTSMRFVDAEAVFDHSLIRIGFIDSWENLVSPDLKIDFFNRSIEKIKDVINESGSFRMSIPMLYMEFIKNR